MLRRRVRVHPWRAGAVCDERENNHHGSQGEHLPSPRAPICISPLLTRLSSLPLPPRLRALASGRRMQRPAHRQAPPGATPGRRGAPRTCRRRPTRRGAAPAARTALRWRSPPAGRIPHTGAAPPRRRLWRLQRRRSWAWSPTRHRQRRSTTSRWWQCPTIQSGAYLTCSSTCPLRLGRSSTRSAHPAHDGLACFSLCGVVCGLAQWLHQTRSCRL
jgi:hypothetical protein